MPIAGFCFYKTQPRSDEPVCGSSTSSGAYQALLQMRKLTMAQINKLSVEKTLEKLRGNDPPKSKSAQHDEKIDALDEEIKRMRAQRLRLDRHQRKRD